MVLYLTRSLFGRRSGVGQVHRALFAQDVCLVAQAQVRIHGCEFNRK